MKQTLKRMLYPVRKFAARFANIHNNTIIFKAAELIAAERVEGDYLEFGCYAGGSFIQAYHVVKNVFERYGKRPSGTEFKSIWENMRFFAFDSFQGLPSLDGVDKESRNFTKGKYFCTETTFHDNLVKAGVPLSKVVTVPGWFEDTCTAKTIRKYGMSKASVIYVDSDLYASAKTALDFVKPLLTDGTIIIFDDWYSFHGNPNLGEQRAFNEWKSMMTNWSFTEFQKEGPWKNSFIASRCHVA